MTALSLALLAIDTTLERLLLIKVLACYRYLSVWPRELPLVNNQTTYLEGCLTDQQIKLSHATKFFAGLFNKSIALVIKSAMPLGQS